VARLRKACCGNSTAPQRSSPEVSISAIAMPMSCCMGKPSAAPPSSRSFRWTSEREASNASSWSVPRRGVNPPALRAISAALQADYGRPDKICLSPVSPIGGYQAAAQEVWVRGTDAISAIYRDTSLQAFEGCLFGVASGYCGLTGQLLVRISPADGIAEPDPCFLTNHRG